LIVTLLEATVRTPEGRAVIDGDRRLRYQLAAEDIPMITGELILAA
jgi:hypothetical protein